MKQKDITGHGIRLMKGICRGEVFLMEPDEFGSDVAGQENGRGKLERRTYGKVCRQVKNHYSEYLQDRYEWTACSGGFMEWV